MTEYVSRHGMDQYDWYVRDNNDKFIKQHAVEITGTSALQTAAMALRHTVAEERSLSEGATDVETDAEAALKMVEGQVLVAMDHADHAPAGHTFRYEGKDAEAILASLKDEATKLADPNSSNSHWIIASRHLLYSAGILSRPQQATVNETARSYRLDNHVPDWANEDIENEPTLHDEPRGHEFAAHGGEENTTDEKVFNTDAREFRRIVGVRAPVDEDTQLQTAAIS